MIKDLSKSQNEIIESFYKDNKPLFIYGESGCGKSTLGKEILKKYQVNELNSFMIKKYKNIKEYILNTISKKNITLMFSEKKERGLIIDDLDVFQKLDKKSYKEIISFLKEKKYYSCKIVVIFNSNLFKKKELYNLDYYKLYLKYSDDDIENIIGKNKYNDINNLHILFSNTKNKLENDIFKDQIEIVKDILENKQSINKILGSNLGDENIFLLNLLENIYHIIPFNEITQIYERYLDYDLMELYSTKNHIWEIKAYSKEIILRNIYDQSIYKNKSCEEMIRNKYNYNSYISKSILSITSKKYSYESYISILLYLFMINKKKKEEYNEYIKDISNEKIKKMIQIYNSFY